MSKDPKRQALGRLAKAKGKAFEARIDEAFTYYAERGYAVVEKTPEPMRILKDLGNGKFIACMEKKAQPDYKGVIKGGRTVMYEAKFTSTDRMEQSRVLQGQSDYLTKHENLGARCYIIAGFASGETYLVPWAVWQNMKTEYGRKYVTEADLDKFRVQNAWNGVLMLMS